jgi:hypothetical protein
MHGRPSPTERTYTERPMPTFREQVEAIIEHRDRYEDPTGEMLSLIRQLVDETIRDGGHNTPLAERNVRRAIKRQLFERLGE